MQVGRQLVAQLRGLFDLIKADFGSEAAESAHYYTTRSARATPCAGSLLPCPAMGDIRYGRCLILHKPVLPQPVDLIITCLAQRPFRGVLRRVRGGLLHCPLRFDQCFSTERVSPERERPKVTHSG